MITRKKETKKKEKKKKRLFELERKCHKLELWKKSSDHSSMVSMAACYWGGTGFKSWQGR